MIQPTRRLIMGGLLVIVIAVIGWTYQQSLVPAIHADHDHPLESLDGGGYLRVESVEGGRRNLVGRPGRVLILHWFQLRTEATATELPILVDYTRSLAGRGDIEVLLIATGTPRKEVLEWAGNYGIPTDRLYVDPRSETASLIGVRDTPETLIYGPDGQFVHQANGAMNWADPGVRAAIEGFVLGRSEPEH